jgi:hypothetical protein
LFELTEAQWIKVYQRVLQQRQKRIAGAASQLRLFDWSLGALLALLLRTG